MRRERRIQVRHQQKCSTSSCYEADLFATHHHTVNTVENITPYLCDVSDYEKVKSVADRIRQEVIRLIIPNHCKLTGVRLMRIWGCPSQIGHPTIIVNNAGVVKGKPILDLEDKDITK